MSIVHPTRLKLRCHAALFSGVLITIVAGCSNYDLTFNEQPIGPTPKLAEKIRTDDPGLSECIDHAVHDGHITELKQLTRLTCPQNRIRSLQGIVQLQQLSYLNLAGNRLEDVSPLLSLPALSEVDLRGNDALNCKGADQLAARGIRVHTPSHCR